MIAADMITRLEEVVGKPWVYTDEEALARHSSDATRFGSRPDAVVSPRNTEEVAGVVRLACAEGLPVTPRGAGTGLSGGSIPIKGGIVISTERMNSPAEIHKEDLYAVAAPGLVTEQFHKQVEAVGLFYPPDPASQSLCTIGGNVAECATGLRGLKYGTTRRYVLGLEVVTPGGEVIRMGARTVKNVAGYDVTRLMVGSEGTLGIVTGAILKLLPRPHARRLARCRLRDIIAATEAVTQIMAEGFVPSALEVMDEVTAKAVGAHLGRDMGPGVSLLIEFDGTASACREDASKVEEMLRSKYGSEVEGDVQGNDRDGLWAARRSVLPALERMAPTVVVEDVNLPRSMQPRMASLVGKIAGSHGLAVAVFGHVGAGNMHIAFLTDCKEPRQMKEVEAAVGEVMRGCVDLGGTVSGEYGIGLGKAPFVKLTLGGEGYEIMRRLKASLDPEDIMNPGKMFYDG
jgi:glycolate oxidase